MSFNANKFFTLTFQRNGNQQNTTIYCMTKCLKCISKDSSWTNHISNITAKLIIINNPQSNKWKDSGSQRQICLICLTFIEKLGSQRPAISGKAEEVSHLAAYECGKSTVKHRTRLNMMIKQMLPVMENYAYFSFFSKNETQLKSRTITTRSTPTTLSILLHLELLGIFNFFQVLDMC